MCDEKVKSAGVGSAVGVVEDPGLVCAVRGSGHGGGVGDVREVVAVDARRGGRGERLRVQRGRAGVARVGEDARERAPAALRRNALRVPAQQLRDRDTGRLVEPGLLSKKNSLFDQETKTNGTDGRLLWE